MNEITQIHLGRQPFTISVAAHKLLRAYLDAIEDAAGKESEVTKEVELRMAELLLERGITGDKVVLSEDIEFLQAHLGEPSDFREDDDKSSTAVAPHAAESKRLYRDTDNALVAGVSSGLAAYFGVGATAVRLLFILLTLFSFVGLLIYVILWLLVPEAKTQGDRLKMRGKPVTIDGLKQVIERADVPGAASRTRRRVGPTVERLARLLLSAIGVGFIMAGLVILVGTALATSYFTFRGHIGGGIQFLDLGYPAIGTLVGAAISLVILAFFVLFMGVAIIKRHAVIPGWVGATAVGLLIVSASMGTISALNLYDAYKTKRQELTITKSYPVKSFRQLELVGDHSTFQYVRDDRSYVEVTSVGQEYDDSKILKVKDDKLWVVTEYARPHKGWCGWACRFDDEITKITIHGPVPEAIWMQGQPSTFTTHESLRQSALRLEIYGKHSVYFAKTSIATATVKGVNANGGHVVELQGLEVDEKLESSDVLFTGQQVFVGGIKDKLILADHLRCVHDNPLVRMLTLPKEVVVVGQTFTSQAELNKLQNRNQDTIYNCIDS